MSNSFQSPQISEVGKLARLGAKWPISVLIVRQLIGIVVTAFLARLLLPDDFGLIAMVVTLTGFLNLISDMGLSWATVYDPQDVQEQTGNPATRESSAPPRS